MTSLKDQNKLLKDAGKGVTPELKALRGFKIVDSKQKKLAKAKYLPEWKKNATTITKGNK